MRDQFEQKKLKIPELNWIASQMQMTPKDEGKMKHSSILMIDTLKFNWIRMRFNIQKSPYQIVVMQHKDYFTYEGPLNKTYLLQWLRKKTQLIPSNFKKYEEIEAYNNEYLHNKESMIVYTGRNEKQKADFVKSAKQMIEKYPHLNFGIYLHEDNNQNKKDSGNNQFNLYVFKKELGQINLQQLRLGQIDEKKILDSIQNFKFNSFVYIQNSHQANLLERTKLNFYLRCDSKLPYIGQVLKDFDRVAEEFRNDFNFYTYDQFLFEDVDIFFDKGDHHKKIKCNLYVFFIDRKNIKTSYYLFDTEHQNIKYELMKSFVNQFKSIKVTEMAQSNLTMDQYFSLAFDENNYRSDILRRESCNNCYYHKIFTSILIFALAFSFVDELKWNQVKGKKINCSANQKE
ncbi:UNKNOWN [Stylonychia lemnae]|uniref:Uncharacterized protein n=1 Tax=Stylonychia lemnae TaxID=5949 RepID=A0A078A1A7_STYLE|nr:UNKNOWN [Stylonychia lemnae]|eukprot:CDW76036.1 UNKNOWN [Stylonychia lemnae]